VPLEASNNAVDFSSSGSVFEYLAQPVVSSIRPTGGAVDGGTRVQLEGADFVGGAPRCRFSGTEHVAVVGGTLVSSHLVWCLAPPARRERSVVAVDVSADIGADFSRSGAQYEYQLPVSLSSLAPPRGPVWGGTRVSVFGAHFVPSLRARCRFGTAEVSGAFVSSTRIDCEAPRAHAGVAHVEISANGVDFSRSRVQFAYQAGTSVLALLPDSGPVRGETNVSVIGTGLLQGSQCRFGQRLASRVVWVSPFEVICTSVSQPEGRHALEVSGSGALAWTTGGVEFAYTALPRVHAVAPAFGPEHGATRVEVSGDGFVPSAGLTCRFGCGTPVRAQWRSRSRVFCQPPASALAGANVSVEVSTNGQQFSTGGTALFEYEPAAQLLSIQPTEGPAAGGTLVIVRGRHFSARAAANGQLCCRFGQSFVIPFVLNPGSLHCRTPVYRIGATSLSVCTECRCAVSFFSCSSLSHYNLFLLVSGK
jgi:hypothetical protein